MSCHLLCPVTYYVLAPVLCGDQVICEAPGTVRDVALRPEKSMDSRQEPPRRQLPGWLRQRRPKPESVLLLLAFSFYFTLRILTVVAHGRPGGAVTTALTLAAVISIIALEGICAWRLLVAPNLDTVAYAFTGFLGMVLLLLPYIFST